jgi:hypothetical protein
MESPAVTGFKYLINIFNNYEHTYKLFDVYSINSDDKPTSLYFINDSFENDSHDDHSCKKLTINPEYKDKFIPEFLSIYLTVYANHYLGGISDMLTYVMPRRYTNDYLFSFYQHIDIPYFTIEKQELIVKTYNTIINSSCDSD